MRTSSGESVPAAFGGSCSPLDALGGAWRWWQSRFLAAALALLAAFSASLRTTCSTRTGNERRCWMLTKDNAKKASPGTGLPYKLAKKRSRPWVRLAGFGGHDFIAHRGGRPHPHGRHADERTPKTGRPREHRREKALDRAVTAPVPAQREMPSIVTRPVITSMANAIRLHWRRVVAVTWGWRHWKSAKMSIEGFFVELRVEVVVDDNSMTIYDRSPFKLRILAKVLKLKTTIYWFFSLLEKAGYTSLHDNAQHRMAKNPLQLGQHNLLIFRCLHVCQAIWPKTIVFGQRPICR